MAMVRAVAALALCIVYFGPAWFSLMRPRVFLEKSRIRGPVTPQVDVGEVEANKIQSPVTRVVFIKLHSVGSGTLARILFHYADNHNLTSAAPGKYYPSHRLFHSTVGPEVLRRMATEHPGSINIWPMHVILDDALDLIVPGNVKIAFFRKPFDRVMSSMKHFLSFPDQVSIDNTSAGYQQLLSNQAPTAWCGKANAEALDKCCGPMAGQPMTEQLPLDELHKLDYVMIQEHYDWSLLMLRRRLGWGLADVLYLSTHVNKLQNRRPEEQQLLDDIAAYLKADGRTPWGDRFVNNCVKGQEEETYAAATKRFEDQWKAFSLAEQQEMREELVCFQSALSTLSSCCARHAQDAFCEMMKETSEDWFMRHGDIFVQQPMPYPGLQGGSGCRDEAMSALSCKSVKPGPLQSTSVASRFVGRDQEHPVTRVVFMKLHSVGSGTLARILFHYADNHNLTSAAPGEYFPKPFHSTVGPEVLRRMAIEHPGSINIWPIHAVMDEALDLIVPGNVKIAFFRKPFDRVMSSMKHFLTFPDQVSIDNTSAGYQQLLSNQAPTAWCGKANAEALDKCCGPMAGQPMTEQLPLDEFHKLDYVMIQEHYDWSLLMLRRRLGWGLADVLYLSTHVNKLQNRRPEEQQLLDDIAAYLKADGRTPWGDRFVNNCVKGQEEEIYAAATKRFEDQWKAFSLAEQQEMREELVCFQSALSTLSSCCARHAQDAFCEMMDETSVQWFERHGDVFVQQPMPYPGLQGGSGCRDEAMSALSCKSVKPRPLQSTAVASRFVGRDQEHPVTRVVFMKLHSVGSGTLARILFHYADNHNLTSAAPGEYFPKPFHSTVGPEVLRRMAIEHPGSINIWPIHAVMDEALDLIVQGNVKIAFFRKPFDRVMSSMKHFLTFPDQVSIDNTSAGYQQLLSNQAPTAWCGKANAEALDKCCGPMAGQPMTEQLPLDEFHKLDYVMIQEHYDWSLLMLRRRLGWGLADVLYLSTHVNKLQNRRPEEQQLLDDIAAYLKADGRTPWGDRFVNNCVKGQEEEIYAAATKRFEDQWKAFSLAEQQEMREELVCFQSALSTLSSCCARHAQDAFCEMMDETSVQWFERHGDVFVQQPMPYPGLQGSSMCREKSISRLALCSLELLSGK
ncbi:unnamed protein product [Symbiodinium sp. CCMP2592]|nr:unnamed protein product [Symbiodinium sp. CCMP2592]